MVLLRKCFYFRNMVMQIEWTSVTWRWWFLHTRGALCTNTSGSFLESRIPWCLDQRRMNQLTRTSLLKADRIECLTLHTNNCSVTYRHSAWLILLGMDREKEKDRLSKIMAYGIEADECPVANVLEAPSPAPAISIDEFDERMCRNTDDGQFACGYFGEQNYRIRSPARYTENMVEKITTGNLLLLHHHVAYGQDFWFLIMGIVFLALLVEHSSVGLMPLSKGNLFRSVRVRIDRPLYYTMAPALRRPERKSYYSVG